MGRPKPRADEVALPGLERNRLRPERPHAAVRGLCRSALNKVPHATALPLQCAVNGYRSCSHLELNCGNDTDPYQRAEGRYALMPGIIGALAESGTPLSILTKRRDLPLIVDAAAQVPVGVAVSLAVADPELHKQLGPGTPS